MRSVPERSTRCTLQGVILVALFSLVFSTSSSAAVLFLSGWEDSSTNISDCSGGPNDALMDLGVWDDYGPGAGSVCAATPDIAQLSTVERHSGSRSLQVHFKNGDGGNGPDFRIVNALGGNRTNTYFREYIKWDANWKWAGSDHKTVIFGGGGQSTQDVYFNIRGNNGGGATGRIAIHVIPSDTVLSDTTNGLVVPGRWYLIEGHIVSGVNGRIEAKLDGVPLTLATEAGNTVNPANLNTGSGIDYVKLDTTYNVFSYFEANVSGGNSNVYYDDVAVCDSWCGPVGGGADTVSPAAPTNLRQQ